MQTQTEIKNNNNNNNNNNNKGIAVMVGKDGSPIYLSSNSPKVWGSYIWSAMFMRASRYPIMDPSIEETMDAKQFYLKVQQNLPCEKITPV